MSDERDDLELVRHMLGVGSHIKKRDWGYRNYFAASDGGSDREALHRLVARGLVVLGRKASPEMGGHSYFHATEAGMDAIGLTSAQKRKANER